MADMTPSEARDALVELYHRPFGKLFDLAAHAEKAAAHAQKDNNHA